MASKAGRVQFKDIKVGKTFWMVRGGACAADTLRAGLRPVSVWHEPERVVVTQKPFRTEVEDQFGRYPEWTFEVQAWYSPEYSEKSFVDCGMFGIDSDVYRKPIRPTVDYLFTTRNAALRYRERMVRSHNYRVAFEHPLQWTRSGLRKRISTDWQGKKTIYGDIPTRTNNHRPWLHYAPHETLIGGILITPQTPQKSIDYFLEQSTKELGLMYPHVIEPIVGIDPAKGEEGVKITSLVLGNGDQVTKVYTEAELNSISRIAQRVIPDKPIGSRSAADRHVRDLHRMHTVIVPKAATQDPEQRAQLEKDFVILDEAHMPPITDQGDLNAGTAHAVTAALHTNPRDTDLFVYYNEKPVETPVTIPVTIKDNKEN